MKSTRRQLMYRSVLLAAAPCWCASGAWAAGTTARLSLTTGALPPLSAAPGRPGFVTELARAAFGRVGVEVEVTTAPPERALINANAGLDDGDILRVAGLERDHPNLIRVPEKVLDFDFVAYAKRSDVRIANWADLQPHSVAFATGWNIFEVNVAGVKEVTRTPSIQELFPLLEAGRADVVLLDRWQGLWIVHQ